MQFNPTNYPIVTPVGADTVLIRQTATGAVKSALVSAFAGAATPISLVENIDDLKNLALDGIDDGALAQVAGYYSSGDGGGGPFYYDATSSVTANDGTIIAPASNVGRWIRPASTTFNVLQFGARGTFDDATDAILATISAAEVFSQATGDRGVVVYIPAGQYMLTAPLVITRPFVSLVGDGSSVSGFFRSGDYGNTIEINSQTGVTINGLYCYTYANTTNGAHIYVNGTSFCRFNNLFLRRQYGGIHIYGGGAEMVDVTMESGAAFTSNQAGSFGMKLEYNTTTGLAPSINCVRVSVAAIADAGQSYPSTFFPPEYGIQILAADSAYFTSCYSGNCRVNVHIKSTNGRHNTDQSFSNCFFDGFFTGGPTEYGVLIEDDAVPNSLFGLTRFTGCFFGGQHYRPSTSNSGRGISGSSTQMYRLSLSGCSFQSIGKEAINLSGIRDVAISGGTITNVNASNTSAGAIAFAGASKQITVSGVVIGDSSDSFAPAVAVALAGTVDVASVVGNSFRATSGDPVLVSTTGVNLMIESNSTENNGDIASATALALPAHNDYFRITGTTNITSITGGWRKRRVTLRFSDVLTFTDGNNLVLAGNFVTSTNDTITLVCDGTDWFEVSRSNN